MVEVLEPGVWRWRHPKGNVVAGIHQTVHVPSLREFLDMIPEHPLLWRHVRGVKDLPFLQSAPPAMRETYFALVEKGAVIIGISLNPPPLLVITLNMAKGVRPENLILELAALHEDFPPDLAAILYAASLIPKGANSEVPTVIASINRAWPVAWTSAPLPKKRIERLVDQVITRIRSEKRLNVDISMPAGPIDRVRWLMHLSRLLWRPAVIRDVAHMSPDRENEERARALGLIALLAPMMTSMKVRLSSGADLSLSSPSFPSWAWPQVLEFERGAISASTLNFLTQNRLPWGKATVNKEIPLSRLSSTSAHLVRATVQSLLEEANKGPFLPSGNFTVFLPRDYPLREWGVSALRISAFPEPESLWVAVLDQEGHPSVCFQWRPDGHISRWVVSEPAVPIVELTLAALWHDLRVARERAFPERSTPPSREGSPHESARQTGRTCRERTVAYLPRTVYRMRGKRAWGGEAERHITRRAHWVRAHLRRLPDGRQASEDAKELATRYGYVLPRGYTFVRPHVRGTGMTEQEGGEMSFAEREITVVARGLVTVSALLQAQD